jgi:hypothetical protein
MLRLFKGRVNEHRSTACPSRPERVRVMLPPQASQRPLRSAVQQTSGPTCSGPAVSAAKRPVSCMLPAGGHRSSSTPGARRPLPQDKRSRRRLEPLIRERPAGSCSPSMSQHIAQTCSALPVLAHAENPRHRWDRSRSQGRRPASGPRACPG